MPLKCPQNGVFPPFVTPQDFLFKNRALSFLYPYGAQTSCKKLEKTNEQSLRYSKTDTRTDPPVAPCLACVGKHNQMY